MDNIFSENIPYSVGIIISLLAILARFRIIWNRRKKDIFAKASSKLINTFNEFRTMLETNFQYEIGRIEAPIPDHIAAAFEFMRHLGWLRRKGFNRKLAQYKQCAEKYQNIEKYVGLKNIPHEANLELLKIMDSLLKYAKPI